jgi:hypothetical protein
MIVDPTEREDFNNEILRAGFAIDDFDLSEQEDPLPPVGIWPVTGKATIRYKPTGVSRTYRAGNGTAWGAEFERDLKAGRF